MSGRRWHHWRPRWRRKRRHPSAWQPTGVERLNPKIEQLKHQLLAAKGEEKVKLLEKLLVLQTPRAALAQAQMDIHPGGYHHREKRLFELIDFNDTFVDLVLALPHERLQDFAQRIKVVMTNFCRTEKTPMFTDEQFDAIVRGLSREIAVFLGARAEGFNVTMTSRVEDAFGIDMVIIEKESGTLLNIDCKTPSAFRHRLEDLEHEHRITTEDLLQADQDDFIIVRNRSDAGYVPVTILCVRPERLGEVKGFQFADTRPLGRLLHEICLYSARHQG